MHGRDHGQNGNGQEKDGQDRAHGLAFFGFAPGLLIDDMFLFRNDHEGLAKRFPYSLFQILLSHVGKQVDLGIGFSLRLLKHFIRKILFRYLLQKGFFQDHAKFLRRHIGKTEGGIIRHQLIGIRDADHVLAGLDQSQDRA